ncbi:MAG: hypothetical protein COW74_11155 [Piscirickettsiaceae bacterium CG18_big_fil_WC_8_21_14_2_50_44_103]|nr:MAG: hypothetical protein COW74_11155 [Piscirickettsiaceae bacterium CG18_big_fil_WC_8_21_14_2_50_44_103]
MQFVYHSIESLLGLSLQDTQDGAGFSNADLSLGSALYACRAKWNYDLLMIAAQLCYRYRNQIASINDMSVDSCVHMIADVAPDRSKLTLFQGAPSILSTNDSGVLAIYTSSATLRKVVKVLGVSKFRSISSEFTLLNLANGQCPKDMLARITPIIEPYIATDEVNDAVTDALSNYVACEVKNHARDSNKVCVHFHHFDANLLAHFKKTLAHAKPHFLSDQKCWALFNTPLLLEFGSEHNFRVTDTAFVRLTKSMHPLNVTIAQDTLVVTVSQHVPKAIFEMFSNIEGATFKVDKARYWTMPITCASDLFDAIQSANQALIPQKQSVEFSRFKLLRYVFRFNEPGIRYCTLLPMNDDKFLFYAPYDPKIINTIKSASPRPHWSADAKRWVIPAGAVNPLIVSLESNHPDIQVVILKDSKA